MTKKIIVIIISAVLVFAAWTGWRHSHHNIIKKKITIGYQVSPAMALIMVAQDRGFFANHGLSVDLKEFTAGKFALQAFFGGSLDFAVPGDVPAALAQIQGNRLTVVTQVVKSTHSEVRIVAQKDDATSVDPKTYFTSKRRTLATSFGGGPEFYTYKFLTHYGIPLSAVNVISQRPEDMPLTLAKHSADAVSIFDPYAYFAEQRTLGSSVTFPDPNVYSELYLLVARPEWLKNDQDRVTIQAVIQSLIDAASFAKQNPGDAQSIVQKYTKLDVPTIKSIWGDFEFQPALTQSLLDSWNAEYDWAVSSGKTQENTKKPDFRSGIDESILTNLDPSGVDLH